MVSSAIDMTAPTKTCIAGAVAVITALAAASCQSRPDDMGAAGGRSPLTSGMVKKTIAKGLTTQTEILEVFGPPDLQTHKDGRDVWTYEKTTVQIEESEGYWTVIFVGGGSAKVTSSSRSSMVIIYFDEHEVVADYRLSIVKY